MLSRSQIFVYGAVAIALLLLGARSIRSSPEAESPPGGGLSPLRVERSGRTATVHVAGAVRRPGVYRLSTGARVTDAVRVAGGAKPGARLDGINLAARLSDGQQVVVPARRAAPEAGGPGSAAGPVSLGSATLEQLEELDGVGPVIARKIVEYRDQRGGLGSVEDLDRISGIGPKKLDSIRSQVQP
jgi:competence protein ComEA